MANREISSRVILVVDHRETGKSVSEIRVIEWTIDGKRYKNLEKRDLFRDETGREKMGKAKGFNLGDFKMITEPATMEKILRAYGVVAAPVNGSQPAAAPAISAPVSTGAETDF